jgi:hypothetical protein
MAIPHADIPYVDPNHHLYTVHINIQGVEGVPGGNEIEVSTENAIKALVMIGQHVADWAGSYDCPEAVALREGRFTVEIFGGDLPLTGLSG